MTVAIDKIIIFLMSFFSSGVLEISTISGIADQPTKENKITPNGKKISGGLKRVKFEKLNFGRAKQKIRATTAKKRRFVKSSAGAINLTPRKTKKEQKSQKMTMKLRVDKFNSGENKIFKKFPAKIR